jgi:hypothetical protein
MASEARACRVALGCVIGMALLVTALAYRHHSELAGAGDGRPSLSETQIKEIESELQSADAGKRLASATALLRLGRLEGGPVLFDLAAGGDVAVRKVAAAELGRVVVPMAEAVGGVVDWPSSADVFPSAEQLASARSFWTQRATDKLLQDVEGRLAGADPCLTELDEMLVRRDRLYRVAGKASENHQ